MSFGFYQFYSAYGGPNYNDLDFSGHVNLDEIEDESAEFQMIRKLARQASDSGRYVLIDLWSEREPVLAVEFPAGETSRHLFIHRHNCALFRDIPFGEYEFLTRYDAIWNRHLDTVEVSVENTGYVLQDPGHVVTDQESGAELRLGSSSRVAQGLLGRKAYTLTLTLAGARIGSVDEAHAKLESIGAAFLFQAGLADGYLYSLVEITSAAEHPARYTLSDSTYKWRMELSFPHRRIEPEPLALYYYAGTLNSGFPLLKFLAYYQVLEYFFVRYSSIDVVESVSSVLIQSGFHSHDVGLARKIVDHVQAEAGRRGFGSERAQLLATVTKCVDPESLRSLLTEHDHDGGALGNHLADRRRIAGVALIRIGPGVKDAALLESLSNRIYDLRNRIVHAKQNSTDGGKEPLFPFSRESRALQPDIEVLRYVAASVLIKSAINITA